MQPVDLATLFAISMSHDKPWLVTLGTNRREEVYNAHRDIVAEAARLQRERGSDLSDCSSLLFLKRMPFWAAFRTQEMAKDYARLMEAQGIETLVEHIEVKDNVPVRTVLPPPGPQPLF
jgi:hypothetical protein